MFWLLHVETFAGRHKSACITKPWTGKCRIVIGNCQPVKVPPANVNRQIVLCMKQTFFYKRFAKFSSLVCPPLRIGAPSVAESRKISLLFKNDIKLTILEDFPAESVLSVSWTFLQEFVRQRDAGFVRERVVAGGIVDGWALVAF